MNPRRPISAPLVSLGFQPEPFRALPSPAGILGRIVGYCFAVTVAAAAVLGFFAH